MCQIKVARLNVPDKVLICDLEGLPRVLAFKEVLVHSDKSTFVSRAKRDWRLPNVALADHRLLLVPIIWVAKNVFVGGCVLLILWQSYAHSEVCSLIFHISVSLSLTTSRVSLLHADQLLQLRLRVMGGWMLAQDEMWSTLFVDKGTALQTSVKFAPLCYSKFELLS